MIPGIPEIVSNSFKKRTLEIGTRDFFKFSQNLDTTGLWASSIFFKNKTPVVMKIFSNSIKNKTQGVLKILLNSFKDKAPAVPEVPSNFFKMNPLGVLQILLNCFKSKTDTRDPQASFKFSQKHQILLNISRKGCSRFFQIFSTRLQQHKNSFKNEPPRICLDTLSNFDKIKILWDSFKFCQKHYFWRLQDSFKFCQKHYFWRLQDSFKFSQDTTSLRDPSTFFKNKTPVVLKILSNSVKNKTQGVLKILLNSFKAKTPAGPEILANFMKMKPLGVLPTL